MDPYVKEERMRMLEKEFGVKVKHRKKGYDSDEEKFDEDEDEAADLVPGSLTREGKIVRAWQKLAATTRAMQILASLITAAVGIGSAFLIKVPADQPAAPRGKIPTFVLYGVSAVSTLALLYLFVFRPCCCDPVKRKSKMIGPGTRAGGMVIPVLAGQQQQKSKNPFKSKGKMGRGMPSTTVNLIVDPSMLGKGNTDLSDSGDEDIDEDEEMPGEARRRRRRRRSKKLKAERAALQGLWHLARRSVKLFLIWDIILLLLWLGAVALAFALGKRCPSGSSGGWCDWYNGTIASACVTAVTCLAALWWDVSDLRSSAKGPRPGASSRAESV